MKQTCFKHKHNNKYERKFIQLSVSRATAMIDKSVEDIPAADTIKIANKSFIY